MPRGARSAPSTRNSAGRRWPRATRCPRVRTWPRPPSTTTSPSSCSSTTWTRCAPRTRPRCAAWMTRCPTWTRRAAGSRSRSTGSRLVGVLRQPPGAGPHPVMIMIPGLDSAKEELRSTEELFLARGVATFSVDGPGQGEAEYDLAIRGDWEVPGAAIIDQLSTEPGLDAARIGVWGVSLGGYYAPTGGQRRRPGPRLRGAGRPVQLRRPLGRAAQPDQGGVPGPVQVPGHGRGPGRGRASSAWPGGPGRSTARCWP